MDTNRRGFLRMGAAAAGALLISKEAMGAARCVMTPAQTAGPFYPGESKFTPENDLTRVNGLKAQGQVVYVRGQILDQACKPVAGVNVEIWQACVTGRYNNKLDPNPAAIDPNFRYWGETFTDGDGRYEFKTIIPGQYPADTDWMRPAHIHFRVAKVGYAELITQMYFKDDKYNATDLILQAVPADTRESVIVDFQPSDASLEPGSLTGEFNITINSLRF